MGDTNIEWTDKTWNPVTGCTRVSPGCDNCYAVIQTVRAAGNSERYKDLVNERRPGARRHFNGTVKTHADLLDVPKKWRKPRRIFVPSMSDLFHQNVPLDFIQRVFDVIWDTPRHTYQMLTKRPERAVELAGELRWPANLVFGTSVEDDRVTDRIDALRQVPAFVRFLSLEPLLGPLDNLNLTSIHWVIGGGESGPRARQMKAEWARSIRDQCVAAGVPYFHKQWGRWGEDGTKYRSKKAAGSKLDGRLWREYPAVAGFKDKKAIGEATPPPLTDEQWERVAPVLPGREETPGGTGLDNRAFINGVRWKAWTLKPWRDLPDEFGNWNTYAVRVKRWKEGGHWPGVCERLNDPFVARFVGVS